MIAGAVVVFKSTHPDVLAAPIEKRRLQDEFNAAIKEYKAKHGADGVTVRRGHREARVSALIFEDEEKLPQGWRWNAHGYAVPDKRYKAGKEAAKELEALPGAPYTNIGLPGMDNEFWEHRMGSNFSVHHPQTEWVDGICYAVWQANVHDKCGLHGKPVEPDAEIWTEISLPEYYAAVANTDLAGASTAGDE